MYYKPIGINGVPDSVRRSCYDCASCQAAVSWWCADEEAKRVRGTSIPGVTGCPYWAPLRLARDLRWWERWFLWFMQNFVIVDLSAKCKDPILKD